MKKIIDKAKEKCFKGIVLSKDEIVELLDISIGSDDDLYLRRTAREAASKITDDNGYIWSAVGIDYAACKMNCKFCSFGEKWGIVKEDKKFSEDEIFSHIETYARNGATYIILRTTEFYEIEKLLEYVKISKKTIKGNYKIVLNTGIFDANFAERAYSAGVYGIYQACRIKEGIDTKFSPNERIQTMKNIAKSRLKLISLTEPIGEEHSNEEIARTFLNTVHCGTIMGGVMARVPVKGTPFGNIPIISEEKIAHITAALRLSGGNVIKDICTHPASSLIMNSGANVLVVESGAIPRAEEFSEEDWANTTMLKARNMLENAGYKVLKNV